MPTQQKQLSDEQIQAFRRPFPEACQKLVKDFTSIVDEKEYSGKVVVDVGGGCGTFAKLLSDTTGCRVRVLDTDQPSLDVAAQAGVETVCGDALSPPVRGDEGVICFSLVLHHLIGATEKMTAEMQRRALAVWHPHVNSIFVY